MIRARDLRLRNWRPARIGLFLALAGVALLLPAEVQAYVGPGAGFALFSSFLAVLLALLLGALTLAVWPLRWCWRLLGGGPARGPSVGRVVILGLDGQDPRLTESYLSHGFLPHLSRLRERGGYARLATTLPAESPVAWSSFQTGCNPGRHRIFDFVRPGRPDYLPRLATARLALPARAIRLGKRRLPLGGPRLKLERGSRPFWAILGDHGVFSTILRVPVSFPPEPFHGLLLSAMSVPDLRGTQGTYSFFTSAPGGQDGFEHGVRVGVQVHEGRVQARISGPPHPFRADGRPLEIPFQVRPEPDGSGARLSLQGRSYPLRLGEFTPWIPLRFRVIPGLSVKGVCHFCLRQLQPHFQLYMSPLCVDPLRPALPISHPPAYAPYLARTRGAFCTLGMAEDTGALDDGALDEAAFLKQVELIHAEREEMLFDALEKTRRGLVVCVFDLPDRVQHMFWRYLDPAHPSRPEEGEGLEGGGEEILRLYRRLDGLVGRVMERLGDEGVLMVMSDHGFQSFRRGVNLNSWLLQNGYLELRPGAEAGPWFGNVDWSRTRAYAMGLAGIYLNQAGREGQGIVTPGEPARRLKEEIGRKLEQLRDPRGGHPAIGKVYDTGRIYRGPYREEAPDLVVGFNAGYRVSWEGAAGQVSGTVFQDNRRRWSGDHCIDPAQVPGILFSSRPIPEGRQPSILDLAPTVLGLFGVPVPAYCDGRSLLDPGGTP